MKIDYVEAKQILIRNKSPENWFGVHYNVNPYRGCQHNCIYCDSRSDCYQINNFNDLIVKTNAAELLDDALFSKRRKVTIGTGSMSDPYIPAEKHIKLTEKILKVIIKHSFPLHIVTKSDLILRDLELLNEINKTFVSVCFTITTCNNSLAQIIEPKAPTPDKRLKAIEELSKNNIYTGILFQPILPYLLDNEANIKDLIDKASDHGAKFIIPWFAVTLRTGQREYFIDKLGQISSELQLKYQEETKNLYIFNSPRTKELYKYFEFKCQEANLLYKMKDILNFNKLKPYKQMTIFDIEANNI
ncbi:MAG: radical SAM protein [Candidatus Cloacimonetes bacterium]|nr:radical SAM protein [Candidatus Cloacimonadota bacterium]